MGLRGVESFPPPPAEDPGIRRLTLVDRLAVGFAGGQRRSGPLTVGQVNIHRWIVDERQYDHMISAPLPLLPGTTLDDIALALSTLITRHESLRTTFDLSGALTQRVVDSGELAVDVYREDGAGTADEDLVEELYDRLRTARFDPATDLPLRVAVLVEGDAPRLAAAVYSHIAVDLASVILLDRQFLALLADGADGADHEIEPRIHQPLDQAAEEDSPTGRRRAEVVSRYWTNVLLSAPQCNFPLPSPDPADEPGGATSGWLWSRAAALALPHITARTNIGSSTAVLAALCAVLATRTEQPHYLMQILSSNRFERRLRDYVGTLAADGLMSLEVAAPGFDELVLRTGSAVLKAGRYSPIDAAEKDRVIEDVMHRRGVSYGRYCTYNDATNAYAQRLAAPPVPGDLAAVAAAMSETRVWQRDWPSASELLGFRLLQKDDEFILSVVVQDQVRTAPAEIESLLRGVERLLVAAAAGDVAMDRLAEVTGVAPMPRGPQWKMIDRCWVELPEALSLLQDALHSPLARVFVGTDESGDTILEAYLPVDLAPTPWDAHKACLALLPGRSTAMAPHRYVICDRAPTDLDQLAGWRNQKVIASGDGR